jgi:hypothetical protein
MTGISLFYMKAKRLERVSKKLNYQQQQDLGVFAILPA